MANVLCDEKRLRVLAAIVDGASERAASRIAGVDRETVGRFVMQMGQGSQWLHNRVVRDLACSLIEVDEQWSYVKKKQARVTPEDAPEVGEAWTWLAVDPSSQLSASWYVGKRTEDDARIFIGDLRARLSVMPRLMTSDGLSSYIDPIWAEFGPAVTYAQVIKNYRKGAQRGPDHRYEPPRDPFLTKKAIFGAPDLKGATTAHVERNNLNTRHFNGRMRRLCLAFSKRLANHRAAAALAYTHRNLCWIPRNLRVTPAMAAGITDHVWDLAEFMAAVLGAERCEPPCAAPLTIPEPEMPARQLPNGRGFLRVVPSGDQPTPPSPPVAPIAPSRGYPAHSTPAELMADETGQLDLLSWVAPKRESRQLGLFDE